MKNIYLILFFPLFLFSQVNYSEDISSIIYNNCTECHRDGQAGPMSFTSYEEVASLGYMIEYVTASGYMPPWHADVEYSNFIGERSLSDNEKQLISDWVSNGMIQGDPDLEAEMPNFPEGSAIGDPDVIFTMEESYEIAGNNQDDYRVFVFSTNFSEEMDLKSIEFIPGNFEAVHHVLVNIDTDGACAALDALTPEYGYECASGFCTSGIPFLATGYVPGGVPPVWNNDVGLKLPIGADIAIQVHYAPSSIVQYDQSTLNIFFKDEPIEREVEVYTLVDTSLEIPANEVYTHYRSFEIENDMSLLSVLPHAHLIAKSYLIYAEKDNDTIPIISIPNWDFNWQNFYQPEYMLKLPEGYTVHAYCTYDNTINNPLNPNSPPEDIYWCDYTTCEMFFVPFSYVNYQEGDEYIYLGGNNEIFGCLDIESCNYNSEANVDDGSCGVLDDCGECFVPCCYDTVAQSCDYTLSEEDCQNYWVGFDIVSDPDQNIFWNTDCLSGCTDPIACNYDSLILPGGFDDGSCEYPQDYYDCNGDCLNDFDFDGICDENEGLSEYCGDLDIVSINQINLNQFHITVTNSDFNTLFSYPGFILFNSFGDTIASENVNFFGIGEENVHILEINTSTLITSEVSLHLYTNFYEQLECEWFDLSISDNCTLLPNPGVCDAAFSVFYVNLSTLQCEETLWGGCGGVVPFWTLDDCIDACGGSTGIDNINTLSPIVRTFDILGRDFSGQSIKVNLHQDGTVSKRVFFNTN